MSRLLPDHERSALARRAGAGLVRLCLLLLCALVPAGAAANMANPVEPGDRVGEPSGDLRSIAITRERLSIDLRPVAERRPARVEAVYRVNNTAGPRRLSLVFVANALTEGERGIWLDGRAVPYQAAAAAPGELPESWRAPQTTPGIGGGEPLEYEVEGEGSLRFSLDLPPGPHEIRVVYPATPTAHSAGDPTIVWQLGYVLAPARQWASFGGLDVEVWLPEGWSAESSPGLRREGDRLVGAWDRVPADALSLAAQAPGPSGGLRYAGIALAGLLGLLAFRWLGGRAGAWLGRRNRRPLWALPVSILLGCLWAVLCMVGVLSVPGMVKDAAGEQAAWTYGYGVAFSGIVLLPLLSLVGPVVVQRAVSRGRRLAAPAAGGAVERAPGRAPHPTRTEN